MVGQAHLAALHNGPPALDRDPTEVAPHDASHHRKLAILGVGMVVEANSETGVHV